MTRMIFWEDPYLAQLDTKITGVQDNDVTVDETIFFAFAGGQENDHGTIGNRRVLQARKENKEISRLGNIWAGHGVRERN